MTNRYFELATDPDLENYYAQFAPDATVEDEGHELEGIDAIRRWRSEVPPVTYVVESTTESTAGTDVDAQISGDFTGSPLTLHFHFEYAADGRISVLRIRP